LGALRYIASDFGGAPAPVRFVDQLGDSLAQSRDRDRLVEIVSRAFANRFDRVSLV